MQEVHSCCWKEYIVQPVFFFWHLPNSKEEISIFPLDKKTGSWKYQLAFQGTITVIPWMRYKEEDKERSKSRMKAWMEACWYPAKGKCVWGSSFTSRRTTWTVGSSYEVNNPTNSFLDKPNQQSDCHRISHYINIK